MAASGSPEGVLGVLVLRVFHVIVRTGSLGVQSSLRHRSHWVPWRSELFTPSFVPRALPFETFHVIARTGAGTLVSKLCPSLGRLWACRLTPTSVLGALVLRARRIAQSPWEPRWQKLVT